MVLSKICFIWTRVIGVQEINKIKKGKNTVLHNLAYVRIQENVKHFNNKLLEITTRYVTPIYNETPKTKYR